MPSGEEIGNCSTWLEREIELIRPKLILPVGKLAISQFFDFKRLVDVVGESHPLELQGRCLDAIPLPHPSGASTWHRTEPGKGLLERALALVRQHPSFTDLQRTSP